MTERLSPDLARDAKYQFGTPEHHSWLAGGARADFDFFGASMRPGPGFFLLGNDGSPLSSEVQELHSTTRMVHSFSLGKLTGLTSEKANIDAIIDKGMAYLWSHHRDKTHGGYLWALEGDTVFDDRKLAYGHVFVLLAGASAKLAGHPDADRLIDDVSEVLDTRYWEEDAGLFADEWNRDWTPFSTYRGMNANMHGVEALATAYEATGREIYLTRAGRILDFFVRVQGVEENWRLPEHYTQDWRVDRTYSGNPMFRPAGTTPGHSFEMARLLMQYWDLRGRPDDASCANAWALTERALTDAWDQKRGGLAYTLNPDGTPLINDRYWWPLTEAIGVLAGFLKLGGSDAQKAWYSRLWHFADAHFIDHTHGSWFHEIGDDGRPTVTQFNGKPDVYHSVQAMLFPLTPQVSRLGAGITGVLAD